MTQDSLLTPKAFGQMISYHVRTIHKWIKSGRLVALNTNANGIRPTWRIPQSEVDKFIVKSKKEQKKRNNDIKGNK